MFEFHGWAVIRADDTDDPDLEVLSRREYEAVARLETVMREADDQFSHFGLRQTENEMIVLIAHGLRNHRYQPVIDLFHWIAENLPLSYGLLYVLDNEDWRRGYDSEFRVWRLARGELTEQSDPFLSPYVPVVEPSYES